MIANEFIRFYSRLLALLAGKTIRARMGHVEIAIELLRLLFFTTNQH